MNRMLLLASSLQVQLVKIRMLLLESSQQHTLQEELFYSIVVREVEIRVALAMVRMSIL